MTNTARNNEHGQSKSHMEEALRHLANASELLQRKKSDEAFVTVLNVIDFAERVLDWRDAKRAYVAKAKAAYNALGLADRLLVRIPPTLFALLDAPAPVKARYAQATKALYDSTAEELAVMTDRQVSIYEGVALIAGEHHIPDADRESMAKTTMEMTRDVMGKLHGWDQA